MGQAGDSPRYGLSIGCALLGLLYSLPIGVVAVGLAGGGHGWCSPVVTSITGLFLIPACGVALVGPPARYKRVLSWIVATGMILADLHLVQSTQWEGVQYLSKVWSFAPGVVVLWLVLWVAWQLVLLGHLARTYLGAG
jgi:hypothetical protein